jgi:hypothetical protein
MKILNYVLCLLCILFLGGHSSFAIVSYDFNSNMLTITDSARSKSFDLPIHNLTFMGSASDHYNVVAFSDNIIRVVVTPEGSYMSHATEFNLNDIDPDLNRALHNMNLKSVDFYHHKFVFKGKTTKSVFAKRDYVDVNGYEMPMETLCQQGASLKNAEGTCWGHVEKVSS